MQGKMQDVSNIIFTLSKKYDVNQIDLSGSKAYIEGIARKVKEQESQKYNKNILKFNFI